MSKPSRILITRLSAIGDCVMTLPVANALRDEFPEAEIVWLIQNAGKKLLEGHASIDRFVVVPRGWLKSPRTVWRIRRELRSLKCDWSVDPQSLTKSSVAGWLSGARKRAGFRAPEGREIAPWLNNVRITRTADHAVDSYLELLKPLGIESPRVRFDLPVHEQSRSEMRETLAAAGYQRYAVINPGASWPSKMWPAERFGQIARELGERASVPSVVVWAGDDERILAEQIVADSQGHAVLAPDTNLKQLSELLRDATVMVSADTGPLHIAAALGTPCVAMYGPTKPSHCGPYGSQHQVLQSYYQAGTSRERRQGSNDAMQAISVGEVLQACQTVLQNAARQAA